MGKILARDPVPGKMEVETLDLAFLLRHIADEIERRGIEPMIDFDFQCELIELEPVLDEDDKLWANWGDGLERTLSVGWKYKE